MKKIYIAVSVPFLIFIILIIQHLLLNNKAENEYQEYLSATQNPISIKGGYAITSSGNGRKHILDLKSGRYILDNFYLKNSKDQILKVSPSTVTEIKGSFSWRLFECGIMCFLR